MKIETDVCIGGPLAGKRKRLEPGRHEFLVPVLPDPKNFSVSEVMAEVKYIKYRREVWSCGGNQYSMWVDNRLVGDQILRELLSNPKAFEAALVGYQTDDK